MSTIAAWILVAVSSTVGTNGVTSVIARFDNESDCRVALKNMPQGPVQSFCVLMPGYKTP